MPFDPISYQLAKKATAQSVVNYDRNGDGFIEYIATRKYETMPAVGAMYELAIDNADGYLKAFNPADNSWRRVSYAPLNGYSGFDNAGGGAWHNYINIPVTTIPSEYAQYKVVINGGTVEVYSVDGTLKASGSGLDSFWTYVRSDGLDLRAFDQAKSQLYFYVESWDYVNQKATIRVKLPSGSTELNIAYGNQSAIKSDYEDPERVYDFYWHYSSNDLSAFDVVKGSWTFSSDGLHSTDGSDDVAYLKTIQIFNPDIVLEVKHKSAGSGGGYTIGFGEQYDTSAKLGIYSGVRQGANRDHSAVVDGTLYNTVSYPFNTDWHITRVIWTTSKIEAWIDDDYYTYADVSRTDYPVLLQSNNHEHVWEWVKVSKFADPADFGTPVIASFD